MLHGEMTSYKLAKHTNIGTSQVIYRLKKLIETGLIIGENTGKNLFRVHNALLNEDLYKRLVAFINTLTEEIENIEPLSSDGMKALFGFIVETLYEIDEENKELPLSKHIESHTTNF